jgi:hypothetical protein
VTPAEAREVLRAELDQVLPEERGPMFPTWPWRGHRVAIEVRAAGYAAHTRREHLARLIELPDRQLDRLLADGWDPRDRGQRRTTRGRRSAQVR